MKKIKTVFERDWKGNGKVTENLVEGAYTAIMGDDYTSPATATEKVDGTNIRITIRNKVVVRVEKRRNPTPVEKHKGMEDPWYVDADPNAPNDKYIYDAVKNADVSDIPDGEWSAEAYGKDIQGNPLGIGTNTLYVFSYQPHLKLVDNFSLDFQEMEKIMPTLKTKVGNPGLPIEGIVWHCADGTMYKIKAKDFIS